MLRAPCSGSGPRLVEATWVSQEADSCAELKRGILALWLINQRAAKEGKCSSNARLKTDFPREEPDRLLLSSA